MSPRPLPYEDASINLPGQINKDEFEGKNEDDSP